MLKHLLLEVLNTLLNILIDIWLTGNFPSSWCHSYVVPITKPGKDTSNPTNCCPIALTSCVCKVMERMVNNRLVWYLERNKIITHTQSGFCIGRSTTESFVREAFIQKHHATAIFWSWKGTRYNVEVWHLKRLTQCRSTRPTPTFYSRLPLRQKVIVGGSYFKPSVQETGVPQGSILSVTLFCLKINWTI